MMKSLLTFLLLAVLSTAAAAASLEGNNGVGTASLISSNKNKGRSNFRKLKNKHSPTYAPSAPDDGSDGDEDADADADKDAGVEELLVSTTGATPVTTTVSEETNNDKDTNDEDEEEVGLESTPPADNEAAPTGVAEDETTVTPPADTNNDDDEGCSFCEKGMPDLELIVKDAGGKTCAEVKETAMEQGLDNTCTKIIQPLEYVCCPVLEAGAAGDEDEETEKEVTTTTTTVTADVEGDEDNDGGDEEDNDGLKDEEVSTTTDATTSESVGGDANEFVKDQEGTTENTTTTAATSTAAATEPATSLDACVQSAQSAGQDDPLFLCCETHPDNAICALNKCMDFESQVITCQCQEVKGIANSIIDSNDPMAGYLPEDFDGFLGTFPKCCRSGQVSPKEFNDCSYEEFSEEIMEELEEEFGLQPTDKPTPRPSLVYIPLTDDEDPISSGQGESEDFSNGQKDDSLQGMINTYLDGVESPDEMKSDKNVQVVAISLVVVFLILLLVTAHLVMDYPDGLCASFCRLILKCLCCLVRVLCLPCRAICCKGSDQTRNRRTHAPMRAPFPSDLELA